MKFNKIKTQAELLDIMLIRKKVFLDEQDVPVEEELDGLDILDDSKVMHFGLYDKANPIGVVRVLNQKEYIKLGRICLLQEYRGQKLGKFMLEEVIKYLIKYNTFNISNKYLYLEAQEYAQGFYEKLKFVKIGYIPLSEDFSLVQMKREI